MTRYLHSKTAIHILFLAVILNSTQLYEAISIAGATVGNSTSARIVGGTTTNISNAKFLVQLRINGKFICGGSLVSTQFVITAAHCVDRANPADLTVVGGATYLSEKGVRRGVNKIIKPKNYNKPKPYHMDVAVLKLSGVMTGTNIDTIPLCQANWKVGDYINVFGWGQLSENNNAKVDQVRKVRLPLVLRSKCVQAYKNIESITDSMFCAGDLKDKDSCYGDSGGPAVFQNQLCGLVSWGLRCASNKFPGVYTSIKTVRNFIDNAMKL